MKKATKATKRLILESEKRHRRLEYVRRGKKAARTRAKNKKLRAAGGEPVALDSKQAGAGGYAKYKCTFGGCIDAFDSPQALGSHKFRKHGLKKGEQPPATVTENRLVDTIQIDTRPYLQETAELNVDSKQIVELKKSMMAAGTLASRTGNGATSATVSIDTTDQGREIVEAVTKRVMAEMTRQDLHLTAHVAAPTRLSSGDGIIDTMQALLAGFEQLRDKL